jgi:hypothetical protein
MDYALSAAQNAGPQFKRLKTRAAIRARDPSFLSSKPEPPVGARTAEHEDASIPFAAQSAIPWRIGAGHFGDFS